MQAAGRYYGKDQSYRERSNLSACLYYLLMYDDSNWMNMKCCTACVGTLFSMSSKRSGLYFLSKSVLNF